MRFLSDVVQRDVTGDMWPTLVQQEHNLLTTWTEKPCLLTPTRDRFLALESTSHAFGDTVVKPNQGLIACEPDERWEFPRMQSCASHWTLPFCFAVSGEKEAVASAHQCKASGKPTQP